MEYVILLRELGFTPASLILVYIVVQIVKVNTRLGHFEVKFDEYRKHHDDIHNRIDTRLKRIEDKVYNGSNNGDNKS